MQNLKSGSQSLQKTALKALARRILKIASESMYNSEDIEKLKLQFASKYKCKIPLNSELLNSLDSEERARLRTILKTKPTRSLSGIVTIALMTAPMPCPGKCIYCPSFPNVPKSYTGAEPSTMRAALCDWDPSKIIKARLKQLQAIGHSTEKCEVIIQGGTWGALPKEYKQNYIKKMFDAFNGFESNSLEEAQSANETAMNKVVGLTFETRPDFCSEEEIKEMLNFGATRVELGLQSVYDDVLEFVKRGHDVKTVKEAIKRLKNFGLKVDLHVMLGLPKSSKERDVEMFRILFEDSDLRPDGLKIYPTAVIENTELYELWKTKKYKEIDDSYIIDVLTEAKSKYIPIYCRIKRIMRDIPTTKILAGYKFTNLRDIIRERLKKEGKKCRCIRCREIGQRFKFEGKLPQKPELKVFEYVASGGKEYFISFEDAEQDILLGFLRLRLCDKAFVRELHVYGEAVPINQEQINREQIAANKSNLTKVAIQHKGLGKKLLQTAEELAKRKGYNKLYVISGVGVRQYYAKQGYKFEKPYMVKDLKE
ncbi:MAG: tRNA uridine(34) 5-carboxymethylaminomethyl modification radical SAM/GNAT enzyme Elp3 [Candidatus Nanoarchaeia archaeon]